MHQPPNNFEVSRRHTFGFSINRSGDLDLWPFDLVRIITRRVGNLLTNFGVSGTFRSQLMRQHLSEAPYDIATLTFDLGGHGACGWHGSSLSICVLSYKFVSFSIRKIWRTSGLSISRPGDLDLWPGNWCVLLLVGLATFLPILVFLYRFVLDLSANIGETHHLTLRPWPFILEVIALVDDICVFLLQLCTVLSLNFVGLTVQKIWRTSDLNISRPGDLDL